MVCEMKKTWFLYQKIFDIYQPLASDAFKQSNVNSTQIQQIRTNHTMDSMVSAKQELAKRVNAAIAAGKTSLVVNSILNCFPNPIPDVDGNVAVKQLSDFMISLGYKCSSDAQFCFTVDWSTAVVSINLKKS